jgi:hypothetical protein
MLRNSAKTALLIAALMVGIGPPTGRNVGFANLFHTHPTTEQREARLRAAMSDTWQHQRARIGHR